MPRMFQPQHSYYAQSIVYFPNNTIHLVVVDPGVGTERRAIALKTPDAYFVAPDNGVLSYILQDYECEKGRLSAGLEAVQLTNTKYWLAR